MGGLALVALAWRARRSGLATLGVLLVLGGSAALQVRALEQGPLVDLARNGGSRHALWKVVSEPRVSPHGWWTVVRVERLDGVRGRWRASWHGADDPPVLGTRWRGDVTARPLPSDGFGTHLRSLHAAVRIDPVNAETVADPALLTAASERVRDRVRRASARWLPPGHAGLATGLVTGDTRMLPPADEQAMRDAGLTHLVAVSGANVALVVLTVGSVVTALGGGAVSRRWGVGAAGTPNARSRATARVVGSSEEAPRAMARCALSIGSGPRGRSARSPG